MALADTSTAIGKVTELLQEWLGHRTNIATIVGRPEPPTSASGLTKPRLNLFLYEALFDPGLKSFCLDEGQPPPLWLVLKYLITSFDDKGESDTAQAHENLGKALRALQELSFLPLSSITLDPAIIAALRDNPEVLKITFDETPSELLSKLMQGSDEKYRFSMSFQVRPVMIATGELPSYSLLVGVDYSVTPPDEIGEKGIRLPVTPSMVPSITEVSPSRFEVDDTLTLRGVNLDLTGLTVRLGAADVSVTDQRPDSLQCTVDGDIAGGGAISAGSHALSVVQTLPTGRRRSSNLLVGALVPRLVGASTDGLRVVAGTPAGVAGRIVMDGMLLGREQDDIFVALYRNGKVVSVFDGPFTNVSDQTRLTLEIQDSAPVAPGDYLLILRVNGQQARNSPEVTLTS